MGRARPLPREQSQQHRRGGDVGRDAVGIAGARGGRAQPVRGLLDLLEAHGGGVRRYRGRARLKERSADRRVDRGGEGRPPGIGTVDAIALGVQIDQVGVELPQRLVVQVHPLGLAGPEIDQHDVDVFGQPVGDLLALGRLQVHGDALLALHDLDGGHLGDLERVAEVVPIGRLQLDDASAELRQDRSAKGRRVEEAQLHDRDAIQRLSRDGRLCRRLLGGRRRAAQGFGRVLAQVGRWNERRVGMPQEAHHRPELAAPADAWVLDLPHMAVMQHLRVVHSLFGRTEDFGADVGARAEDRLPLGHSLGPHSLQQQVPKADRVLVGLDPRRVGEAGLLIDVLKVERLEEGRPQMRSALGELEPTPVLGHGDEQAEDEIENRRRPVALVWL